MSTSARALITAALMGTIPPAFAESIEKKEKDKPAEENVVVMEKFVAGAEAFDPGVAIPKEPTGSVFGIAKPPLETPRSISIVSSEMMKLNNVIELQDLQRYIPGSWTAPGFVQGSVNVRGDSADVYYNGMKRIPSSVPTIIGASDGVDIVKGPPSAIFGPGQVGGYMDFMPKSGRASSGKYLNRLTGALSFEAGSYEYYVATAEVGGPLTFFRRPAGYYFYARAEDSKSYCIDKFQKDQLVQGTLSTDLSADGNLRLQIGFNFQNDRGTGVSGWNRVTQDLIDHGTYETGTPRFNMDTNGDGQISYAEIQAAGGMVFTIPFATYAAVQNAKRNGTALPALPALPKAFALDPATMGTVKLDGRQILIERFLMSYDYMAFADLVQDRNPNLKFKAKAFGEYKKYQKFSETSTAQNTNTFLAAATGIVEYKPAQPPPWLKVHTLFALNWRWTDTFSNSNLLNQIYPRIDLSRNSGRDWQPNWIVANYMDHPELTPVQTATAAEYIEYGAGVVADLTFFDRVNLMLNDRKDYLWANALQTRNNFVLVHDRAIGTDTASSWSASISYALTKGIRPYATYADERTYLSITPGPVRFGTLQTPSKLTEFGLKMNLFSERLFVTLASYNQFRSSLITLPDGSNDQQQTQSKGFEADVRWVPERHWNISAVGSWNRVLRNPVTATAAYRVTAEMAGYGAGNWAGILNTTLPAAGDYAEVSGRPDHVLGLNITRRFDNHFDATLGANYQAGFSIGDLKEFHLPSALTFSGAIGYSAKTWEARLSGTNLTDTRYFTANLATSTLVTPMPTRQLKGKITYKF